MIFPFFKRKNKAVPLLLYVYRLLNIYILYFFIFILLRQVIADDDDVELVVVEGYFINTASNSFHLLSTYIIIHV